MPVPRTKKERGALSQSRPASSLSPRLFLASSSVAIATGSRIPGLVCVQSASAVASDVSASAANERALGGARAGLPPRAARALPHASQPRPPARARAALCACAAPPAPPTSASAATSVSVGRRCLAGAQLFRRCGDPDVWAALHPHIEGPPFSKKAFGPLGLLRAWPTARASFLSFCFITHLPVQFWGSPKQSPNPGDPPHFSLARLPLLCCGANGRFPCPPTLPNPIWRPSGALAPPGAGFGEPRVRLRSAFSAAPGYVTPSPPCPGFNPGDSALASAGWSRLGGPRRIPAGWRLAGSWGNPSESGRRGAPTPHTPAAPRHLPRPGRRRGANLGARSATWLWGSVGLLGGGAKGNQIF